MGYLPTGEPIADSLNPSPSSSLLNSLIWSSERPSTFVWWIERNSMCRTLQAFRTAICSRGSDEISSAKAERMNTARPLGAGIPSALGFATEFLDRRRDAPRRTLLGAARSSYKWVTGPKSMFRLGLTSMLAKACDWPPRLLWLKVIRTRSEGH